MFEQIYFPIEIIPLQLNLVNNLAALKQCCCSKKKKKTTQNCWVEQFNNTCELFWCATTLRVSKIGLFTGFLRTLVVCEKHVNWRSVKWSPRISIKLKLLSRIKFNWTQIAIFANYGHLLSVILRNLFASGFSDCCSDNLFWSCLFNT